MYSKTPVIYVGGTFDLIHAGHIDLLDRCASLGRVTVALNTDEFAARYKRKPIQPLLDRLKVMRSIRYVTEAVVNIGNEDSKPAILKSGAEFIVHGSDWTGPDLYRQMGFDTDWLFEHGISMLYLDVVPDISTTKIIEHILKGDENGAAEIS